MSPLRLGLLGLALSSLLAACGGKPCEGQLHCASVSTIVQCKDNSPTISDCGQGLFCVEDAKTQTPSCVPPFTVSGTVRYNDRVESAAGVAPGVLRAVPGAQVAVLDDSSMEVLGTGATQADGSYTVGYSPRAGVSVHVTVMTRGTNKQLTVASTLGVHAVGGPSFTAADGVTGQNIDVTEEMAARAFNIFTEISLAMDKAMAASHVSPLPALAVRYGPNSDGSFYTNRTIHLKNSASDDDGDDDAVIDHEFGHYVQDAISATDSNGGEHTGAPADPSLAWSEGFATFFSSFARNDSRYMDSYEGGIYVFDLEPDHPGIDADPALGMDQLVSEWMDASILWDVVDNPTPDDDAFAETSGEKVMSVLKNGMSRPGHQNRGYLGIDLVDWLDEWFIAEGAGTCAAMHPVVDVHHFPYDYQAQGASCP